MVKRPRALGMVQSVAGCLPTQGGTERHGGGLKSLVAETTEVRHGAVASNMLQ
jgi:hypothetical protein